MTPDVNVLVAAAQEFLAALLAVEGVVLLPLSGEWPLLEPLCRQHQLVGNAISDGWIAAAVLARRLVLVTFDRDFLPLLPSRQLLLLEGGQRTFSTTHPADTCRPRRGQGWRRRENLSQFLGGVITCAA